MTTHLVPGMRVRHPGEPEWGVGQVQSVVGDRVTVSFEHAGKRVINAAIVALREVGEDEAR
jgi:FKBP-type peptidyl-prolyl cis-trans isomerase 2